MNNKTGNLVAIAALVVIMAALFAIRPQPSGFSTWIAEARDGDSEWGWDLLSPETQGAYNGDVDAYLADMAAVDWAALELGPPTELWSDDGFAHVQAELRSDLATVPAFLLDRRMFTGSATARSPRRSGSSRIDVRSRAIRSVLAASGSQARCNAAFGDQIIKTPASFR